MSGYRELLDLVRRVGPLVWLGECVWRNWKHRVVIGVEVGRKGSGVASPGLEHHKGSTKLAQSTVYRKAQTENLSLSKSPQ